MEVEVELENLKKDYEELLKQHVELRKRQMEPVIYLFQSYFLNRTSIKNLRTLF